MRDARVRTPIVETDCESTLGSLWVDETLAKHQASCEDARPVVAPSAASQAANSTRTATTIRGIPGTLRPSLHGSRAKSPGSAH